MNHEHGCNSTVTRIGVAAIRFTVPSYLCRRARCVFSFHRRAACLSCIDLPVGVQCERIPFLSFYALHCFLSLLLHERSSLSMMFCTLCSTHKRHRILFQYYCTHAHASSLFQSNFLMIHSWRLGSVIALAFSAAHMQLLGMMCERTNLIREESISVAYAIGRCLSNIRVTLPFLG